MKYAFRKQIAALKNIAIGAFSVGTLYAATAHAATPPNTIIQAQSKATYFSVRDNTTWEVVSNYARIRVLPIQMGRFERERVTYGGSSELLNIPHQLTNTGNISTSYNIQVENLDSDNFDLSGLQVLWDRNGNGIADPGEPMIALDGEQTTLPIHLNPNETAALVMIGTMPPSTADGAKAYLTLSAELIPPEDRPSTITQREITSLKNTVIFEKNPQARVFKQTNISCGKLLTVGEPVEVEIQVSHAQRLKQRITNIDLGNQTVPGVLLYDELSTLVALDREVEIKALPPYAVLVASSKNVDNGAWRLLSEFPLESRLDRVGMIIPEDSMAEGHRVGFIYQLRSLVEGPAANIITGGAALDYPQSNIEEKKAVFECSTEGSKGLTCFADTKMMLTTQSQLQEESNFESLLESQSQISSVLEYQNLLESSDGVMVLLQSDMLNIDALNRDGLDSERRFYTKLFDENTEDSATVELVETGVNTGVFMSTQPIILSEDLRQKERICTPNSQESCFIATRKNSQILAELSVENCNDTMRTAIAVSPYGTVFNSATFEPVANAKVSIFNRFGALLTEETTDIDGVYHMQSMPFGAYYFSVAPDSTDLSFPSQIAAFTFTNGTLTTGHKLRVTPVSYGELGTTAPRSITTLTAGMFEIDATHAVRSFDIPLDSSFTTSGLAVEKTASTDTAQIGELVRYTVTIRNLTRDRIKDVIYYDEAPFGFNYVADSFRIDQENDGSFELSDLNPELLKDSQFTFKIPDLAAHATMKIDYVMRLGAGALDSDGINHAWATGINIRGFRVGSVRDSAQVKIENEGVFSDRAFLIGRVGVVSQCDVLPETLLAYGEAIDWSAARYQRFLENTALLADGTEDSTNTSQALRYWPLVNSRVWMETGSFAVTDERGYYSLYGIEPGSHVVKLDNHTVPEGLFPAAFDQRAARYGWTRFADMSIGELHRSDFVLPANCAQMLTLQESILKGRNENHIADNLAHSGQTLARFGDETANSVRNATIDGDISGGVVGAAAQNNADAEQSNQTAFDANQELLPTEALAPTITKAQGREGVWFWPKTEVSRDGKFVVVVRMGVDPVLVVNGETVPNTQLGERFENKEQQAQILAWYGVQLKAGENHIAVQGTDPFGNLRTLAERNVFAPSAPSKLQMVLDRKETVADAGRSSIDIALRLVDENNVPVSGVSYATIKAEDGQWQDPDLNSNIAGQQIRLENGVGHIRLGSPSQSRRVKISAETEEGFSAEETVQFIASDRPLMAVGLVSLGAFGVERNGAEGILPVDGDYFDDRVSLDGRVALFLTGRIRGDVLLTLSYDSERDRTLLRDIDPDTFYPVYGDGSERGYEGQTNGPLYVRLERGESNITYGDYTTDNETNFRLSGLNRTLTGIHSRVVLEDEYVRGILTGFVARPRNDFVSVELPGRGLALDYRLPDTSIKPSSEKIEIIVRSRQNSGIILSERVLTRGVDYLLNYRTGRLDFYRTIPSRDADLNFIYIRASYDTDAQGQEYTIAGGRVEIESQDGHWKTGVSYSHSDEPGDRRRMGGVYAELAPLDGYHLRAEGAVSQDADNHWRTAVYVEAAAELNENWRLDGSYGRAETGFKAESSVIAAGNEEARATLTSVYGNLSAELEGVYSHNNVDDKTRQTIGLKLRHSNFGGWRTSVGIRQQRDASSDTTTNALIGSASIGRNIHILGQQISAELEAEKNLEERGFDVGASLEANLNDTTSAYVKYEFTDDISQEAFEVDDMFSRGRFVLGLEQQAGQDTTVYSETRLNNTQGFHTENATGLRGDYTLQEDLRLQLQAENIETFRGEDKQDSLAAAIGIIDERRENQTVRARIEGRATKTERTVNGSAALTGRLTDELAAVVGVNATYQDFKNEADRTEAKGRFGLAYRPNNNRTQLFAQYESRYTNSDNTERLLHIGSVHWNTLLTEHLSFSGRAAIKLEDFDFEGFNAHSDVELMDARMVFGAHERIDLELRGGLLSTGWGDSMRYSAGAGLSFAVTKNLAFSLGYNFLGFDEEDLDAQGYNQHGAFFRLDLKFDEEVFKWLEP